MTPEERQEIEAYLRSLERENILADDRWRYRIMLSEIDRLQEKVSYLEELRDLYRRSLDDSRAEVGRLLAAVNAWAETAAFWKQVALKKDGDSA